MGTIPKQGLGTSVTIALSTSYNSDSFDMTNQNGASLQINKTGVGTGTAKIQESNDGVNWTDVSGATFTFAAGAVSSIKTVTGVYSSLLRAVITETGGLGTMVVFGKWIAKEH